MKMLPHERELVQRYASRPFAIVGVNGDGDEGIRKASEEKLTTWPRPPRRGQTATSAGSTSCYIRSGHFNLVQAKPKALADSPLEYGVVAMSPEEQLQRLQPPPEVAALGKPDDVVLLTRHWGPVQWAHARAMSDLHLTAGWSLTALAP